MDLSACRALNPDNSRTLPNTFRFNINIYIIIIYIYVYIYIYISIGASGVLELGCTLYLPPHYRNCQIPIVLRTGTKSLRATQEYPQAFAQAIARLHLDDESQAPAAIIAHLLIHERLCLKPPYLHTFYTYMLMNSKDLFPRGSVSADVLAIFLARWGGPEFG